MLNVTNFVDDGGGGGGAELFKYVDLGMRDKLRAAEDNPAAVKVNGDASPRGIKTLPPTDTNNSGGSSAETAIDLSADTSMISASCSSTSADKGWTDLDLTCGPEKKPIPFQRRGQVFSASTTPCPRRRR